MIDIKTYTTPCKSRSGNYPEGTTVVQGSTTVVGGGSSVDIVKELDTTTLTDANVLSSKRVLKEISDRGHTHTNLSALNEISTDTNGYQYLTQLREVENPETGETTVEQVTEKVKAGYADVAKDLSEDSPVRDEFLSKIADDVAAGKITFKKGADFGANGFLEGLLGYGGRIDEKGNAFFRNLVAYDSIWTEEFRFNRVDVVSGELWNSFSFGRIDSVDTENQIITLDLDDNEWGTVKENDICRAIFNNSADVNNANTEDGQDDCGFVKYKGYYTSYFSVVKIVTNEAGKCQFSYNLRAGSPHPTRNMKFAAYGNFTDTSRQSSSYITRTYERFLRGVNTWVINPNINVAEQLGQLDGLSLLQTDGTYKNLTGTGAYFNGNVYLNGAEIQLSNAQLKQIADQLGSATTYSVHLSQNAATLNVNDDGYPEKDLVIVTKDADGKVTSSEYLLRSTLFAYKGSDILLYDETSGTSGAYSVVLQAKGCTADFANGTVRILSIAGLNDGTSSYDQATMKALKQVSVDVQVSCEGEVILTQTFTTVINHVASIYRLDLSNEASAINCDKDGNPVGQFETSKATVYKGGEEDTSWNLSIDDKDGATATIINGVVTVTAITKDVTSIKVKAVKEGFATMYSVYTITKVYAGADGSPAVSYTLVPSVSSIKISKNGTYSTANVTCGVLLHSGADTSTLSTLPEGITMQYSTDNGVTFNTYTLGSNVDTSGITTALVFKILDSSNKTLDVETIPLLIDGTDGTGYVMDLTNQASTINCNNSGTVVGTFETTQAVIYNGAAQDTGWTFDIAELDGATATISNGLVTVTGVTKDVTSIKISATKSGYDTRYAIYTITKVYAGADGTDAISYRLVPSASVIKINSSGVHSITTISCGLTRATGAKLEALTSLPTGVKMQYSIDNGANYTDYTFGSVVNVSSATVAVIFSVYNTTNYYNFDVETIPVLIDGTDGTDGKDGDTTQYIFCRTTNNTAPSTPAHSDADAAPTGWTLSPSGVTASYPYEWISQRIKTGGVWGDYSTPVVFSKYGANGNDGQNGTFRQSIFMLSNTQPSTPTTLNAIPTGWSAAPQTAATLSPSYSGAFLLKGLYRVSQTVADSGYAMDKVSFTTTQANQKVVLKLVVSSETNHDYAYIGNLDVDYSGVPSSYYQRYSGSSSVEEVITVPTAGSHFIEVIYAKDASSAQGTDNVKYLLTSVKMQWTSSAQATWTSGAWVYDAWTVPVQYLPDSADMEMIFRRSTYDISSETPVSDELKDGYIPPVTENWTQFDSTLSQTSGVFYKYNDVFYKCIQSRSENSSIAITNTSYFTLCQDWTDNAQGISETIPYEYISKRKKSGGKWGAFSAPALYAKYNKGDTGAIPYPAGVWSSTYNYVKTSTTVPFVLYEGSYYYLNADSSTGDTPSATSIVWKLFNMLQWVFTNVLFANFANLGSAIFYGNYMFSQQGVDANGNASTSYQNFTDENGTTFKPNLLFNFLTGYTRGKKMDIEGTIRSKVMYTPFTQISADTAHTINPDVDGTNIFPVASSGSSATVILPDATTWNGLSINIFVLGFYTSSGFTTTINTTNLLIYKAISGLNSVQSITPENGIYRFTAVAGYWVCENYEPAKDYFEGKLISNGLILKNQIVASSNATIEDYTDNVIVNYSSGDCTLTLPVNPEDGKVIKIFRTYSNTITVNGNGKYISATALTNKSNSITNSSWGTMTLTYVSALSTWLAEYSRAM